MLLKFEGKIEISLSQWKIQPKVQSRAGNLSNHRPKEGFLILWPSRASSWSGVLCVVGKNVNFYAKKSSQVAASGRFRHDHAGKNISFVWDQSNVSWWRRRIITIEKSRENRAFEKTDM